MPLKAIIAARPAAIFLLNLIAVIPPFKIGFCLGFALYFFMMAGWESLIHNQDKAPG
jgi:hypothetical protein